MQPSPFLCLHCQGATLQRGPERLACPVCGALYPLLGGVPILLPSKDRQEALRGEEGQDVSLEELQAVYDRVYEHDGLMGSDLDGTYDRVTKETLLSFAEPLAGKRLLDVGTGAGNLWGYAPPSVVGYALDISLAGVRRAAARFPNLIVSVSTSEFIPYADGFFDAVLAADTVEHTFSPRRSLREIHRVLGEGGILGASFPIPDSLRKWGWNQLVHERPNLKLMAGLIRVLVRRTLLFGRPDFQPIDRDYGIEEWLALLQASGFCIGTTSAWPEPPRLPIVTLVQAIRI
jgi:SAM-dependent methyltransferase